MPFPCPIYRQQEISVLTKSRMRLTQTESLESLHSGGGRGLTRNRRMKNALGLAIPPLPRNPNITATLQRLIKSFAQLFALQREEDEEAEMKMEIGFPTDVQHVTHIGIDGASMIGTMENWVADPAFLSFQSLDLEEFELAMAGKPDAIAGNESIEQGW